MDPLSTHINQARQELQQIEDELQTASAAGDQAKVSSLSKRYTTVQATVALADRLAKIEQHLAEATSMLGDAELQATATEEIAKLTPERDQLITELQEAVNPPDPNDGKDIIVEIRAGAGGDEAALFAAELFRMYSRYAERKGWKTSLLSSSQTGIGGLKEITFEVSGQNVYRHLKHESGVHRVQRVPDTEKNGRVHTSTVTVAVVPVIEESELVIDPKDLKIIASTSSGAGGQSVNTTYSAIRMTHIPTGITVSMQDERSQTQNRIKAMSVMRARLQAKKEEEERQRNSDLRKNQIGTGDRSEKIRTYNFPQDRVTDHRIKLTVHTISRLLDGELDELIDALRAAEIAQRQAA